jgi:hypothetical protein
MESIKYKSIIPYVSKMRGKKRKCESVEKLLIIFEKNEFKMKRYTKKKKITEAKKMREVFQDRTVSYISSFINEKICIEIPSETLKNVSYTLSILVKNSNIGIDCNCQRQFLGEGSKNRTNCKHVAFILKTFLYNYFCPKNVIQENNQIIIYDVINFLNQEKLCIMNYDDPLFRSRFMKAYKVLDRLVYLYPDLKLKKSININMTDININFEKFGEIKTNLIFSNGGLSAVCDCNSFGKSYKCKHINNILVTLIKNFIFSFKPNKKLKKIMSSEEVELSKLFEDLKL